jgi:hypothetical protein
MLVTHGPGLPTCALQQVGSYLGYTGHQINVVVTAARDPKQTAEHVVERSLPVTRLGSPHSGRFLSGAPPSESHA